MDCCCYSYLYLQSVHGYDPEDQAVEEESVTVAMPVLFDEVKKNFKNELADANSEEVKVAKKESEFLSDLAAA